MKRWQLQLVLREILDITNQIPRITFGEYFFRIDEPKQYYGATQNNEGEWVSVSSNRSAYYAITLNETASWSGILKVKLPVEDITSRDTTNFGFKIGRYTSASDSAADWTDTIHEFSLVVPPLPSPSPTPTPTVLPSTTPSSRPSPSVTPRPTSTPTSVASTPTPHPTVASTPSFPPEKLTPTPLLQEDEAQLNFDVTTDSPASSSSAVLGAYQLNQSVDATVSSPYKSSHYRFIPWMTVIGSLFILAGVLPLGWKHLQEMSV